MEKVLVRYNEYFYYGVMSGLFICTKEELETLKNKEVDFGCVLGKHSEVTTDSAYDYCEVISADQNLTQELLSIFGGSIMSGHNPLDYVQESEDEDY